MGAVTRVAIRLTPKLVGSLLIIALVTGAAGGLATGLVAGGTRARTAVDRLIAHTRLPDVMMFDPTLTEANVEQMRAQPAVRRPERRGVEVAGQHPPAARCRP